MHIPQDDAESLRRIVQTSDVVKRICAPLCAHSIPLPNHSTAVRVATLPPPPSIRPKLARLGLEAHLVEDFAAKYDRKCAELHSVAQLSLQQACREFAALPEHSASTPLSQLSSRVIAAYTTRYTNSLELLEQRAVEMATKRAQARGDAKKVDKKPRKRTCQTPFNHEFTPVLEKYFEYNAYPSSADQAAMAKKSRMEQRQIDVWFQNRRARTKKEGGSVRRLHALDSAPLDLCLKSMEERMEPYLIPDGLRQEVDSDVSEPGSDDEDEDDDDMNDEPEIIDLTDVLNPPAPRHAYPVKFKDSHNFASTILKTQEFSFPAPNWVRRAATAPPRRADISIDEMREKFAALHVYDSRQVNSPAFQIPTTIVPESAPLPALVRKIEASPVLMTKSLNANTVGASRTRARQQRPFRSPSPYAQPATLVSAGASGSESVTATPRRKKTSGPPRRTPKKRANHRGASPATSETSTLRSVSPPSRTPSFGSSSFSSSRTPYLESGLGFGFSSFSPSRAPSRTPSLEFSFSSRSSSSSSSASSSGPATPSGSPSPSFLPLQLEDSGLPFSLPDSVTFAGDFTRVDFTFSRESIQTLQGLKRKQPQDFGVGFARYADVRG
ncbi:hypothetical protein K438DRAFT_1799954 [Mycena galopus ATCC 62051]|nr:hypothetical protein K438DRAFT_1799954 [Mycena galopus ATCC 62051]